MRYGTSYFTGTRAAYAYYRHYGSDRAEVNRKIDAGEIHIGRPPLKPGETCQPDEDGRYIVTTEDHPQ